ncbi:hypothetical protein IWW37_000994 [Coemansia sp. RSA 2050]|nr:hypothetical protein IWW37_000994 [Coemansia sp. RSA 2050]KAJ2736219.1 hypothetical protein IW152_000988 [Coemansia sp. BCRC 34962]
MAGLSAPAKVLVVGSVNGRLAEFFAKVKKLDAKYGPFSVLLVTGNLLSRTFDDDSLAQAEVESLLKNEISVPIMTYVVVGDRRLPQRLYDRAALRSGEVCSNMVLLSGRGVLQTSEGIKIAYIGGKYRSQALAEPSDTEENQGNNSDKSVVEDAVNPAPQLDTPATVSFDSAAITDLVTQVAAENEKALLKTQAQPSVDVLLTYDWPYGVVSADSHSSADSAPLVTHSACNKVSFLSASIMPRYHFAASEGVFYERLPWKYSDRIKVGRGQEAVAHFTRFIGLGSVNESEREKERWFYAMNVSPLGYASQGKAATGDTPRNCTANPLYRFGRLGSALDSSNIGKALSGMDSANGSDAKDADRGRRAPPPLSYVCRCCSQPGHWIQDCPAKGQNKRPRVDGAPPAGYICHGCQKPGHWRAECPSSAPDSTSAADMHAKCWFCLANPDVDQNLMAAIGDEAYVAMSKGALVAGGSSKANGEFRAHTSPIPGGGHVLIVPIVHTDSLRRAREANNEADKNLCAEVDRWTEAIASLFAEFGCVPLAFETCRCLPHVHTLVQMIPIPQAKAGSVRPVLEGMCKADGLSVGSNYPPGANDGYLSITDPADGSRLIIPIPRTSRSFNLQFGRKLAAHILDVPEREDWKKCVVSEAIEATERDRFIAAFAKYDFTRAG